MKQIPNLPISTNPENELLSSLHPTVFMTPINHSGPSQTASGF